MFLEVLRACQYLPVVEISQLLCWVFAEGNVFLDMTAQKYVPYPSISDELGKTDEEIRLR
ncbi:hypothetical protein BD310DRAFT_982211 [Dichomitus squalens]|uniref:Uncharacterized protein n=1 Tax=Dichomitus squalens TaxID=114155 RepID=A0A4Q9PB55_9APHY|nr:hypothetical protein BD310DRAFT_982211 [Dichomitus squalens]